MATPFNVLTITAAEAAQHIGAWVQFEYHMPYEDDTWTEHGYLHHVDAAGEDPRYPLVYLYTDMEQTLADGEDPTHLGAIGLNANDEVIVFPDGAPDPKEYRAWAQAQAETERTERVTAAYRQHTGDPEVVFNPADPSHALFAAGFSAGFTAGRDAYS
jgi:hypothetical protein